MRSLIFTEIRCDHGDKTKERLGNRVDRHTSAKSVLIHHSAVLYNSKEIQHDTSYSFIHDCVPVYYLVIYKIISERIDHVSDRLTEWDKQLHKNTELELNPYNGRNYGSKEHHQRVQSLSEIKVSIFLNIKYLKLNIFIPQRDDEER